MVEVAVPCELEGYLDGIRLLISRYPDHWSVICAVEQMMRSDQWDLMYEEEIAKDPGFKDTTRPWGSIILRSAFNGFEGPRAIWWERNLTRALDEQMFRGKPSSRAPRPSSSGSCRAR